MKPDKLTMGIEVKSCKDCERIEPLKGTWLPTDWDDFYTCSVCKTMRFPASKFCPDCGALMSINK